MGCMLTNFTQTLQDFLSRWTDFTPLPAHDITQSEDSLHSPVRVHHNVMHGHPSIQLTHCGTRTERAKHEQIFRAVRSRDKQMLRSLILDDTGDGEGGQSLVCAADRNGVNPVELACLLGYTDEVMLFIEHGCSPNLPTSIGRLIHTVLECMKSQSIGVPEGSQLLNVMCEQGCDVRMKDRKRKTTLLYATELGDINVLELVIKYGGAAEAAVKDTYSGYTPLHMAAMKGDLTCLRVLLREGPASQINMLDNSQRSALLLALKMMIHDLRYLHNDPTEISGPNREKLILHQYNSIAVVEALLVAGADANQGDPLSCALELVQLDEENRIMLANCDGSPYLSSLNRRCQIVFSPGAEGGPASPRSVPSSNTECVSPYTGVVRLLIYSGAQPQQADQWRVQFKSFPYVLGLVDEITDFWKCYQMVKPPKLLHLCKQCIRTHLAKILKLHQIDSLSLPSSMIDYLKLRCL